MKLSQIQDAALARDLLETARARRASLALKKNPKSTNIPTLSFGYGPHTGIEPTLINRGASCSLCCACPLLAVSLVLTSKAGSLKQAHSFPT